MESRKISCIKGINSSRHVNSPRTPGITSPIICDKVPVQRAASGKSLRIHWLLETEF